MKNLIAFLLIIVGLYSCESGKSAMKGDKVDSVSQNDTIKIANEELEYEIIILEQGFNNFLATQPPESYYSETFLENKNYFYVTEYNRRVQNLNSSRELYPQTINYDPNVHYGLEVNYLLYNYFQFFEKKYNQKLK
jgi:hypothetical protein